jgi:hypothetical protein
MSVKEWLLTSQIAPFYWEALLTFAMSLPMMLAMGMLFVAAFRGKTLAPVADSPHPASPVSSEPTGSSAEPMKD